jgi:oligopeptide transport system ATP-binding protein
MPEPLLTVESLSVEFRTDDGVVRAVNDVSFQLEPGERLGIVGESGSGKSVTNLALMGLIPQPPGKVTSGRALYRGQDLLRLTETQQRQIRGRRIAMIFQDPMTALNPFLTVSDQLTEMTRLHLGFTQAAARKHAIAMLEQVGIPGAERRLDSYPHEFSGGMRQRVMIAMALSCNPEILIADEPTTALDVTIQAQILDLIRELQKQHGTSVILITHALGVVANLCRRVLVMYAGRIVEEATVESLFAEPRHPSTLGLLKSIPGVESSPHAPRGEPQPAHHAERGGYIASGRRRLQAIEGQPPNMTEPPAGCPFHPRCPFAQDVCDDALPPLVPRPEGGWHRCLFDITRYPEPAVRH